MLYILKKGRIGGMVGMETDDEDAEYFLTEVFVSYFLTLNKA